MSEPAKPRRIQGHIQIKRPAPGRAKLCIATPSYGGRFSAEYVASLFSLLTRPERGFDCAFIQIDFADVVVARNYLLSNFYYRFQSCSHLLFLDDDMGFEPALIDEMLALGEDVVGTLYPKRKIDLKKLHASGDVPFEKALARSLEFIGDLRRPLERRSGFSSVTRCGTGIMLISRACIDAMIAALPDLVDTERVRQMPFAEKFPQFLTAFDKIVEGGLELSEDFSFCKRWIDSCGGKVWAHTGRNIRHVGRHVFESKFADL